MSGLGRAIELYNTGGMPSLLAGVRRYVRSRPRALYLQRVRPMLPLADEEVTYNGIRVRPYRCLDSHLPFDLPIIKGGHEQPADYEAGLCRALREHVRPGDEVVVVGGGLGVTAVVAANSVGPEGRVICFEGAADMIEHIQTTARLNGVAGVIEVRHGIVSRGDHLEGLSGDASVIPAAELPQCDVLEMDCEGTETAILDGLADEPRVLIVETHGNEDAVRDRLDEHGYSIVSRAVAEIGPYEQSLRQKGVFVLSAVRADGD